MAWPSSTDFAVEADCSSGDCFVRIKRDISGILWWYKHLGDWWKWIIFQWSGVSAQQNHCAAVCNFSIDCLLDPLFQTMHFCICCTMNQLYVLDTFNWTLHFYVLKHSPIRSTILWIWHNIYEKRSLDRPHQTELEQTWSGKQPRTLWLGAS